MIVTGLIGYPTDHSISPMLFNMFAKSKNLEYSHVKINVPPRRGNLKKTMDGLVALGIRGVNITIPYKMDALEYIDNISNEAKNIGAINTVVNKNGKLHGYNTDTYGAIIAIETALSRKLNNKDRVLVIGTGGASRAIVYGLLKKHCIVNVAYRNPKSLRTKEFIKDYKLKVKCIPLDRNIIQEIINSNIICNSTNIGMIPKSNKSVINKSLLVAANKKSPFSEKLFFDVVFNPLETKFLKLSKNLGAKTQGGLDMMIYQGILAFNLWTGHKIENEIINKTRKMLIQSYDK